MTLTSRIWRQLWHMHRNLPIAQVGCFEIGSDPVPRASIDRFISPVWDIPRAQLLLLGKTELVASDWTRSQESKKHIPYHASIKPDGVVWFAVRTEVIGSRWCRARCFEQREIAVSVVSRAFVVSQVSQSWIHGSRIRGRHNGLSVRLRGIYHESLFRQYLSWIGAKKTKGVTGWNIDQGNCTPSDRLFVVLIFQILKNHKNTTAFIWALAAFQIVRNCITSYVTSYIIPAFVIVSEVNSGTKRHLFLRAMPMMDEGIMSRVA